MAFILYHKSSSEALNGFRYLRLNSFVRLLCIRQYRIRFKMYFLECDPWEIVELVLYINSEIHMSVSE